MLLSIHMAINLLWQWIRSSGSQH